MPVIDPTTNLGKVRLRVADWQDLPFLPDSVIEATLTDCDDNVVRASQRCAGYIMGILSAKTHRKLDQIETWGAERFNNYVEFIRMTMLNPHLMDVSPIPYVNIGDTHPLIQFQEDWAEDTLDAVDISRTEES